MQDGLLSGEKKKEGCCPNYNFATWSRVLAFLSAIALTIIGVVTISRLESALFAFFATFMICITEMPFCMQCCFSEETTKKMKCLEASKENPKGCLFRGILYLGLCVGGSFMCVSVNSNDIILMLCFILLGVDGLFYIGAFSQGLGTTSNSTFTSAAKRAAKKKAVDYAKENPDQMADFAHGAAQYAIDNPDATATFVRGNIGSDDVESQKPGDSASMWDAADDTWGGSN